MQVKYNINKILHMASSSSIIFSIILVLIFLVSYTNAEFIDEFSSNLTSNNPDDALLLLSDHYSNATEALEFINNYISDNPDQYGAYGIKGWVLNGMNKYIEALGAFDKGISLSKHEIQLMRFFLAGRAHSLYGLTQISEALTRADQAIDNQDINFYGGNYSLAEAYTIKGMSHFEMAEYSKALEAFQKANEFNPDDRAIWLNIGNSYYMLDDDENALRAYNASIVIKPSKDSLYYKGLTLRNLERYDEAIETFKEALELDPEDEDIEDEISATQTMANKNKKS